MNIAVAPGRSPAPVNDIQVSAWILKLTPHLKAAISQYELNHIEENPELIFIPKSPAWCSHVMLWRNQVVPVVDFTATEAAGQGETAQKFTNIIAITRYADGSDRGYNYGAIRILSPPVLEKVTNDQICQAEDLDRRLKEVALSGFYNKDSAVCILDLKTLFTRE